MASLIRRRGPSQFERAADGSMTLMEHLKELRSRLFKASLGIVGGLIVGLIVAEPVKRWLTDPYCTFKAGQTCNFNIGNPVDNFLVTLKIALYVGLIVASPIWLYQLWAFIAPGLHRHERRYTYAFTGAAVPLFLAGGWLGFIVVAKSLVFFLGMSSEYTLSVDLQGYIGFVTGVMLLFGAAFEFPLALLIGNFAGLLSAKRMLGWWRAAIFLMFAFAAIVTPTPDPFGMSALAIAMAILYFGAIGVASINDRRRARNQPDYSGLSDDQASALDDSLEPVADAERIDAPEPVAAPLPLDQRYDEHPQPEVRPRPRRRDFDDMT